MNSNLYGKDYPFPEELRRHLKVCIRLCPNADANVEGYRRNQELQSAKSVTYQQLKRMKNWFDNFQGNKEDAPFILNGGDKMKNWIDTTLGTSRRSIQTTQDRKDEFGADTAQEYVSVVPDTAKLTPDNNNKLVQSYNEQITENLKRINQIMKKIL